MAAVSKEALFHEFVIQKGDTGDAQKSSRKTLSPRTVGESKIGAPVSESPDQGHRTGENGQAFAKPGGREGVGVGFVFESIQFQKRQSLGSIASGTSDLPAFQEKTFPEGSEKWNVGRVFEVKPDSG